MVEKEQEYTHIDLKDTLDEIRRDHVSPAVFQATQAFLLKNGGVSGDIAKEKTQQAIADLKQQLPSFNFYQLTEAWFTLRTFLLSVEAKNITAHRIWMLPIHEVKSKFTELSDRHLILLPNLEGKYVLPASSYTFEFAGHRFERKLSPKIIQKSVSEAVDKASQSGIQTVFHAHKSNTEWSIDSRIVYLNDQPAESQNLGNKPRPYPDRGVTILGHKIPTQEIFYAALVRSDSPILNSIETADEQKIDLITPPLTSVRMEQVKDFIAKFNQTPLGGDHPATEPLSVDLHYLINLFRVKSAWAELFDININIEPPTLEDTSLSSFHLDDILNQPNFGKMPNAGGTWIEDEQHKMRFGSFGPSGIRNND